VQIKNDSLVDIGRLRVANIMQFYAQPKLERIMGEKMAGKAAEEGTLVRANGQSYRETYRNIRLKDQALTMNAQTGQATMTPTKGFTFFEAN